MKYKNFPEILKMGKLPTFTTPPGYQVLNALLGTMGKPFGSAGGIYGNLMLGSKVLDTKYGRLRVK